MEHHVLCARQRPLVDVSPIDTFQHPLSPFVQSEAGEDALATPILTLRANFIHGSL